MKGKRYYLTKFVIKLKLEAIVTKEQSVFY